jgi:hypothetical protein
MNKLLAWLKSHEPVFCAICARLMYRKDARYETASNGVVLPLCDKCHRELFNPFSEEE